MKKSIKSLGNCGFKEHFKFMDHYPLTREELDREFCIGLKGETCFIGIITTISIASGPQLAGKPIAVRKVVVIASSNMSDVKIGTNLCEEEAGEVAPLVKTQFSRLYKNQFFFTDRPGAVGLPLVESPDLRVEKDYPKETYDFSDEEWVYVPVTL